MIDFIILGTLLIFQRLYDNYHKPYFHKITTKNFDARVTKCAICTYTNKLFIGLENGTVQVFMINKIEKTQKKSNIDKINIPNKDEEKNNINETYKLGKQNNVDEKFNSFIIDDKKNYEQDNDNKIIVINEGITFKLLNEKITGIVTFKKFVFVSSIENKLVILDLTINKPEMKLNGSLKKRMEGKGYIRDIFIDEKTFNLFVVSITNKILVINFFLLKIIRMKEKLN